MKQITIDGRVGKDGAKILKTQGGKDYLRFSLANDSFVNGANKTEWFDVTCFDPFMVEKRASFLMKGRYVIVTGTLNTEVSAKDGKIYLNQYVRANDIDFPSFGSKKEETGEQISTFTGGTKSAEIVKPQPQAAPVQEVHQHTAPATQPAPQPQPAVSQAAPAGWTGDEDLPF